MLVTTTPIVEGREINQYKGIVFGEVISGVDFFKDISAGMRNVFGGRTKVYEKEFNNAREEAMQEMITKAKNLKADAIVGVYVDYEVLGQGAHMLMVIVSGTAVTFK